MNARQRVFACSQRLRELREEEGKVADKKTHREQVRAAEAAYETAAAEYVAADLCVFCDNESHGKRVWAGAYGHAPVCDEHIESAHLAQEDALAGEREAGMAIKQIVRDERRMMS